MAEAGICNCRLTGDGLPSSCRYRHQTSIYLLKGAYYLIVIGTAFNKIKLVVIVCCVVKAFASNEIPHSKIKHILDVNNLKGHVISFGWTLQEDVLSM